MNETVNKTAALDVYCSTAGQLDALHQRKKGSHEVSVQSMTHSLRVGIRRAREDDEHQS